MHRHAVARALLLALACGSCLAQDPGAEATPDRTALLQAWLEARGTAGGYERFARYRRVVKEDPDLTALAEAPEVDDLMRDYASSTPVGPAVREAVLQAAARLRLRAELHWALPWLLELHRREPADLRLAFAAAVAWCGEPAFVPASAAAAFAPLATTLRTLAEAHAQDPQRELRADAAALVAFLPELHGLDPRREAVRHLADHCARRLAEATAGERPSPSALLDERRRDVDARFAEAVRAGDLDATRGVLVILRRIDPAEPATLLVQAGLEASFGGAGGTKALTEKFLEQFRKLPLDGHDAAPSQRRTRARLHHLGLPEAGDDDGLAALVAAIQAPGRTGVWYPDRKRCENRLRVLPREIEAQVAEARAAQEHLEKLERERERLQEEIRRVGDSQRTRHDRIVTINGSVKAHRGRKAKAEDRRADLEAEKQRCEQALARIDAFSLGS